MLIKLIKNNALNIPGWRTKRKIVVIESDDWGSIRMPSKKVYDAFLKKGICVDRDPYCRYDSLATPDDLDALFDVLMSVKDKNGKPAVITANSVVANPDFERIKASDFAQYYYEPFIKTNKRSSSTEKSFELWKQGMEAGIFHPQFHGREHLNVKKWMRALSAGEKVTRLAFDYETFGLTSDVDSRIQSNYMGAFNSGLAEDIAVYNIILQEGLYIFKNIFGYQSLSFIPTTYTWPTDIEPELKKNGVKFLQGMIHQRIPIDDDLTFRYKKNNYSGFKSKAGLFYISRNAFFEPAQYPSEDWVSDCLRRVSVAFKWQKPAIISTHRLNFIGAIDIKNRENNLVLFKELLQSLVKKYPDVEFMTSDEVGNLMLN